MIRKFLGIVDRLRVLRQVVNKQCCVTCYQGYCDKKRRCICIEFKTCASCKAKPSVCWYKPGYEWCDVLGKWIYTGHDRFE